MQRSRIEVQDNQQTVGLQDAPHLRQSLCGLSEMDQQTNERCIKHLIRKRRQLTVFQLEDHIGLDSFLRQREHAWRNVGSNNSVRLRYQCRRVEPGAATNLRQLT